MNYISNDNYVACITENIFYDDISQKNYDNRLYNFRKLKNSFREINDIKINILNSQYNVYSSNIYNNKLTNIDYISNRNLTTHIYDEELANKMTQEIIKIYLPELEKKKEKIIYIKNN